MPETLEPLTLGFAGAVIWTGDIERMATFYKDVLGLPVHSSRANFVAFELGGVRLSLGLHSQIHGQAAEVSRVMVNLAVDDIEESYRRLVSRKVFFIRTPEREHWGGWVATFSDPDGNLLQLLQQPPRQVAPGR